MLGHVVPDLLVHAISVRALDGRYEGDDRLAGELVLLGDDGRLGDLGIADDRRLDLGGRQPVARRR